jgi:hypothetical protein
MILCVTFICRSQKPAFTCAKRRFAKAIQRFPQWRHTTPGRRQRTAGCDRVQNARRSRQRVAVPMGPFKAEFLRILSERGYIHQITDGPALDVRSGSEVISA